jgi:general stress protein 26
MEYEEILERAFALVGEGRPGLLSTVGPDGAPRSRWVVPALLPRLKGRIFALTARDFSKVADIAADPRVAWTLQAADFSVVVGIRGRAIVVDDPSFCAELVQEIGPHLSVFWRLNADPSALVAIETLPESATIIAAPRAGEARRG